MMLERPKGKWDRECGSNLDMRNGREKVRGSKQETERDAEKSETKKITESLYVREGSEWVWGSDKEMLLKRSTEGNEIENVAVVWGWKKKE